MGVDFSGGLVKRGTHMEVGLPVRYTRCGFFQPTNKPYRCERVVKGVSTDPSVRMVVNGRLGIPHWKILDALFSGFVSVGTEEGMRVFVVIRKYDVRRLYSDRSIISSSQIHSLLMDLMEASITLSDKDSCLTYSLIESIRYTVGDKEIAPVPRRYGCGLSSSLVSDDDVMSPVSKVAQTITIRFGMEFSAEISCGFRVVYNSALMSGLKHGISRAVVREILAHKRLPNGGYLVDTLLDRYLGPNVKGLWSYKKRELSRDADGMLSLGVRFERGRLNLV